MENVIIFHHVTSNIFLFVLDCKLRSMCFDPFVVRLIKRKQIYIHSSVHIFFFSPLSPFGTLKRVF